MQQAQVDRTQEPQIRGSEVALRKRDPEHARLFFEAYHDAFEACAALTGTGKHVTLAGRILVASARTHFGYSASTCAQDILRTLLRQYKARKRSAVAVGT